MGGPAGGAGVSAVRSWPHVRQTHPSACPRHACADGPHAAGTPSVAQGAQSHRRPCWVREAAVAQRIQPKGLLLMWCSLLAVLEGRLGGGASGGCPTIAGRRGLPNGVDAISSPCCFSRRSTSVAHVWTDRTAEAITPMHHRILPSFLPHDRSSRVHQGATDRMTSPLPHGSIRPLSSASASLVPALSGS